MDIKFAIQIENQFGYNWDQVKEIVTKTDRLGYHSFYVCDHFLLDKDAVDRHAIEAWTLLTAVSQVTERINLGTLVTGNNYRNPAYLAKIAASLDHISGGRMEFGIGTGWKEVEYHAYGYDFPPIAQRMDMLEESIQIIKSLWNEDRSTFDGKYYQIRDAVFSPKPTQDSPLFMIGGGGEKRTLKMVAQYADYMNLPFTPMEQIQQKLDALKRHCSAVGRDFESVGKSMFYPIRVYETEEEVDQYLGQMAERSGRTVDELRSRLVNDDYPGSWVGTPEMVRDRIEYMNGLGFDYYFIQMPIDLSSDLIDNFARLVKDKYFR